MTDIAQDHFQLKKNIPELKSGDRVRVHQKIKEGAKERIQIFEGLVIKTKGGRGIRGSFTVRRISLGVGVEKTYPLHLPTVIKIEKVKSAKVRRAKLFYVRDLVGKKARRLKGEKDDAKVWEDVVVGEVKKDPEQEKIENEAEADKSGKKIEDAGKESKPKEKSKPKADSEATKEAEKQDKSEKSGDEQDKSKNQKSDENIKAEESAKK